MANTSNENDSCYQNENVELCSINIDKLSNKSRFMLDKYIHDKKIGILFVQETGPRDIEKMKLANMKTIVDTNESKNRGTALYIHNSISSVTLPEISQQSKEIDSAWSLVILNKKRYIVGSIYVKHHYPDAIKGTLSLLNYTNNKRNSLEAQGIIMAGDFNARHSAWGDSTTTAKGRQLFEQLDDKKFKIRTSRSPTFLCVDGSSYIDLMIVSTNISDKLGPCYTDDLVELCSGAPGRGHVPLLASLHEKHVKPDIIKEKLDVAATNWEAWAEDLEKIVSDNQDNTLNSEDPKTLWKHLENIIEKVNIKHCKMKKVSHHSKPYWKPHLTILCNRMRKARRAYLTRNTDRRKEVMIETKQIFDDERKKACDEFILEKTKALNTADSLKFWKQFNNLFKKKIDQGVEPLLGEDEEILSEDKDIENKMFATFFEAKHISTGNFDDDFYDATNMIYDNIISNHYSLDDQTEIQQKLNSEITIKEIKWAIKNTKCSGKSVDNNNIHPKMLHMFGNHTLNLLKKLFNCCLNNGEWVWDTAKVIFLKKSGKKSYSAPGSYRPISISSYIGKLLEKILSARVTVFLEAQGIYDPNQEGFTSLRNTIRYLNRLHLEIKSDLIQNNTVIGLFIDFEKAFDSVWKKGLICKMANLNIKGNVLSLIDHFLQSRKVQLEINGKLGNLRSSQEYGLPQGSALSPVLFKIYLLDFLEEYNNRKDIKLYKFADDGTVKIKASSDTQCASSLNTVLMSIIEWTEKWRMVVNCDPNKTEYISFGTSKDNNTHIPSSVKLGNKTINQVKETKVLGLHIDETLSYITHSKKINQKIYGSWAKMCEHTNRNFGFNQRVITQISKTYFLSSLHYAGPIWQNPKSIQEIESIWYKIIKSAVGAIFNVRTSIAEVILGLPPLRIQSLMNQIKHYLKLNIKPSVEDKLRDFILGCFLQEHPTPAELSNIMKEVYKYLQWKLQHRPRDFSEEDIKIICDQDYSKYFHLSSKCCSYTKTTISKYTEMLWYKKLQNEFLIEGIQHTIKPSCSKLPVPNNTTRKEEVLLMSLMYPNNLFNDFLYRHTYQVPSPLCQHCHQQEETPYHIILQCSNRAIEVRQQLSEILTEGEIAQEDYFTLLNASRHEKFIKICLEILAEGRYRDEFIIDTIV